MRRCSLGRALVAAGLGICWVVAPAPTAEAHTIVAGDATHYETQIDDIHPAVRGLMASVDPRGDWIEVTNVTDQTLVILGYAREPYLKVDASGVQENSLSVSAQMNEGVVGDLNPVELTKSLPPAWHPVSTGSSAKWHDLRIHWGSSQRPDGVSAHPDRAQLIARWTVRMRLGAGLVRIHGTLRWLPIRKMALWAIVVLVADVAAPVLGGIAATWWYLRRRRVRGSPRYSVERAGAAST